MDMTESLNHELQKNTISYLHKITEMVPHTSNTLKSYYAFKFRTAEQHTNIHVKENNNKTRARCPRCCLRLAETNPNYFTTSHRNIKFAQKVQNKSKTTKFQRKYLEKNKKRLFGTKFVVKCNFCEKEVFHYFPKPVKKIIVPVVKINKKRKKDKLCGLSLNAVVQAKKVLPNENNTLNNQVLKKRIVKEQKKAKERLTKILQRGEKPQKGTNGLAQFLMSL